MEKQLRVLPQERNFKRLMCGVMLKDRKCTFHIAINFSVDHLYQPSTCLTRGTSLDYD